MKVFSVDMNFARDRVIYVALVASSRANLRIRASIVILQGY